MFNFIKKILIKNKIDDKNINIKESVLLKDNEIKVLVDDFQTRIDTQKEILTIKFKMKPSLNDVYWAILQDLYLENFSKNNNLLLNIEYQRGLLTQKEKGFLNSISHFSNSLVYLKLIFPELNDIDTINKKSDAYKSRGRILRKMKKSIDKGYITKEEFYDAYNQIISKQDLGIDRNSLLLELYRYFNTDFFYKDIGLTIDFNDIESVNFLYYELQFKKAVEYFTKEKNIEQLKQVLHKYYIFGVLHEQCFGNYQLRLGWTHDLASYKIKYFDETKYKYNGIKIKYLSSLEYHHKFLQEYNQLKNDNYFLNLRKEMIGEETFKELLTTLTEEQILIKKEDFEMNYNSLVASKKELFTEKDYQLFDKYLL